MNRSNDSTTPALFPMLAIKKPWWQLKGASACTAFFCIALVSGCSNSGGRNVQQSVQQQEQTGIVSSIQIINTESAGINGGAILGAVLGGVVGNQIGSGSGRKIATGAGVIGGAMAGNEMSKRANGNNELYRVTVRQSNGRTQQFDYQQIGDLQIGDRVRVEGAQIYQM